MNGSAILPITVERADVIITPNIYREDRGSKKNFTMNVTSRETGKRIAFAKLSLYIPQSKDKYYTITTSKDGIGEIAVSGLNIGEYPVTISTNDANLNPSQANATIIINKLNLTVEVISLISQYNSGKTVVLKVTNESGDPMSGITLKTTIDGKDYALKTDSKGQADIATSLSVGTHKMEISVYSNIYTSEKIVKTFNIKKATGTLSAPTTTVYYKSGKYLTVKLINSKSKEPMFNSKIHFQVKKSNKVIANYYGTTNKDGIIRFNINLKPAKYTIVVNGNDQKSFSVKKISSKLTVKKTPVKITAKKSSKKVTIKLINKKTKKAANGVKLKLKVKIGKTTKIYKAKTSSNGIVTLKMKKGSYKLTVNVADNCYSSKALKKSIKI